LGDPVNGGRKKKMKCKKKKGEKKKGAHTGGRAGMGSISAVSWWNRVILLPNDGPVCKRKNRKRIKKKREEMGHAQVKWRRGPSGATSHRRRGGSFSPVFWSNRIVLHSNDGPVSKE